MTCERNIRYCFEPGFALSLSMEALYRDGENLSLRPKTFETLRFLLQNPGRLVTKAELMEQVWSDAAVTDDVLVQSIADIRRALGDDARNPAFVQTVPRRGYIFMKKVRMEREREAESASPPPPDQSTRPVEQAVPAADGKARMGYLIPALLLIFTVVALALWQLLTLWNEDTRPQDRTHPLAMAVLPFDVRSDQEANQWLSMGLADMISTGLWNSPGLEVVSRRRLSEAGVEGPVSGKRAVEAVRRAGAERFISGHFYRLGDKIEINASLMDAVSGETAFTLRERLNSTDDIFQAVDAICLKVLQNLAVERGLHPPRGSDITEFTTPSLEAYRHYITGLDHFLRGGQNGAEQARLELEQAIQIDPSFAMAYFKLAQVEHWAASWGYSQGEAIQALSRALPFSDELPEKERLLLLGLKALWIDSSPDQALATWEELSERYPVFAAEAGIPSMIVRVLVARGELEQAIRHGEAQLGSAFLAADERSRLCASLAMGHRSWGDLEEAVELGQQAVRLWPLKEGSVYANQLINLGRFYIDVGQREKAYKCFQQARGPAVADAANLTDLGWGYYMAGDLEEALGLGQAALKVDPEYGNAHHLMGWIHLAQERYSQAAASLTWAFERTPPQFGWSFHGILEADLPALYYSGVAYQKLGKNNLASMIFNQVIKRCRDLRRAWKGKNRPALDVVQTHTYEGLALCRLGDYEDCLETVHRVPPEISRYYELSQHLARIYALLDRPQESLDWLEKSIQAGNRQFQHLRDNPDFDKLRTQPRFRRLVEIPDSSPRAGR
ncbi:MAG TPA: winged helix-turn-helix domain-containing protein [Acidobacteriota bacterium]|nr:winged helix-turn-helix domain-containing protein [Acidobacteriota bacterium]